MPRNLPCLLATSAMIAIPLLTLNSCDSGAPDTGGESNFDLGTRFDQATLEANLAGIADMPEFLLQGDSFTHDVTFGFGFFFSGENLVEEYGIGFRAGEGPIVADGAGQISNAEGDSLTPNVSYIYDPDTASFSLSEQNSIPANLGDEATRQFFESRTEDIENVPFAQIGSLAQAIAGNFSNEEAARIYEVAIESFGLIAADQGELGFLGTLPGEVPTGASVRLGRTITYQPTSTNEEILDSGTISGNVVITDTYSSVRILLPHDGRGRVLALEPLGATSVNGNIVDYNGVATVTVDYLGTFTLQLSEAAF